MAQILGFNQLEETISQMPASPAGCLVDTSILFALSYPLDKFNEQAESAFNVLAGKAVPAFTNINVRTEFIELHRRVAIPEGLIDLLTDSEAALSLELVAKLKSLRTRYRSAQAEDRSFLLPDNEIKKYRHLLSQFTNGDKDGWELFCEDYLTDVIQKEWDATDHSWNLNFFSTRSTETHPLLNREVTWDDMVVLVERFGMGSMDAMILNLFRNSKLNIFLTADSDLAYASAKLNLPGKYVFIP